jgi:hypothetical protein
MPGRLEIHGLPGCCSSRTRASARRTTRHEPGFCRSAYAYAPRQRKINRTRRDYQFSPAISELEKIRTIDEVLSRAENRQGRQLAGPGVVAVLADGQS